jgi:hypothetical protein
LYGFAAGETLNQLGSTLKLFDSTIVEVLESHVVGAHVESVLLADYSFVLAIGDTSIACYERVNARIQGHDLSCLNAPYAGSWGLLVRQVVRRVALQSPQVIRLEMASGDFIDFETAESLYESVVVTLPPKNETLVMEIY